MVIVTPLHHYFRPAHLEHVVGEMLRRGAPVLRAYFDEGTGIWFAREGTHRLRAAKRLGLAPILIPTPWPKSRRSLERARFTAGITGHVFDRVETRADLAA